MKKIIIAATLIISLTASYAQSRFYVFAYNDKHGITDTVCNEMIKPIYKYGEVFLGRDEIALYNFDDKIKDVIFNTQTGTVQSFDYIHPDEVDINDMSFTFIRNKGKKYLRSQNSDKLITLKKDYYDLSNEGKYIIGKYYAEDPPAPPAKSQKDKNGILLPPAIRQIPGNPIGSYGYDVMTDDETLKPLMKGVFVDYFPLYYVKPTEKSEQDGLVSVQVVVLKAVKKSDFHAIIFSSGDTYSLYNAAMTLVKKFVLKNATKEQLVAKAAAILKVGLSQYDEENAPAPMIGVSNESGYPNKQQNAPPIVYPFFATKKSADGHTQFVVTKSKTDTQIIFETKQDVSLNEDTNTIRVSDYSGNDWLFRYNAVTGKIYLPKKYWQQVGLMVK